MLQQAASYTRQQARKAALYEKNMHASEELMAFALKNTEMLVQSGKILYDKEEDAWKKKIGDEIFTMPGNRLTYQLCDPRSTDQGHTIYSGYFGKGCSPRSQHSVSVKLSWDAIGPVAEVKTDLSAPAGTQKVLHRYARTLILSPVKIIEGKKK